MLSDKCSLLLSLTSRPTKNLRTTEHYTFQLGALWRSGWSCMASRIYLTMLDMSTAILHNTFSFKMTMPPQTLMLTVNETLPLGDYHSLQFCLSVIDSLLKGNRNSTHWIKISAVRGPHVGLDEVDVFFSKIVKVNV